MGTQHADWTYLPPPHTHKKTKQNNNTNKTTSVRNVSVRIVQEVRASQCPEDNIQIGVSILFKVVTLSILYQIRAARRHNRHKDRRLLERLPLSLDSCLIKVELSYFLCFGGEWLRKRTDNNNIRRIFVLCTGISASHRYLAS